MRIAARIFLVLIALTVVGVACYFWFVQGSEFTKLTFEPGRRNQPLLLVTLQDLASKQQAHELSAHVKLRELHPTDVEYTEIFDGEALFSSGGVDRPHWQSLKIEGYVRTADYIDLVTGPEFLALKSTLGYADDAMFAQYAAHVNDVRHLDKPVVVLLSEGTPDTQQTFLLSSVERTLIPFDGEVQIATPVERLSSGKADSLNYLAVIEFNEWSTLLGWLEDTIRKSQFVLLSKHIERISLVVAVPKHTSEHTVR